MTALKVPRNKLEVARCQKVRAASLPANEPDPPPASLPLTTLAIFDFPHIFHSQVFWAMVSQHERKNCALVNLEDK